MADLMNQPEKDEAESEFQHQAESFSKKKIFPRRPKKASEIIGQLLARKGYSQQQSIEQIQLIWDSIVDPKLKGMTKATGIKAKKLVVIVKSAIANQELTFQKKELLKKIKESPIGRQVNDLRIQLGVF